MTTPERRKEIARLGGLAIPREKRSFFQNRELAKAAGRKGGSTPRRTKPKLTETEITEFVGSVAVI